MRARFDAQPAAMADRVSKNSARLNRSNSSSRRPLDPYLGHTPQKGSCYKRTQKNTPKRPVTCAPRHAPRAPEGAPKRRPPQTARFGGAISDATAPTCTERTALESSHRPLQPTATRHPTRALLPSGFTRQRHTPNTANTPQQITLLKESQVFRVLQSGKKVPKVGSIQKAVFCFF